jgi:hypothetical protein
MTPKQLKRQIRDVEYAIKAFRTRIESMDVPTTPRDEMHLQNLLSTKQELMLLKEQMQ